MKRDVHSDSGGRGMDELIARLKTQRAELVETMAKDLAAEENWGTWLPLLAQVQAAIRAVEAVESDA